MTGPFGDLLRRQLKFRISVKPLSPVHIGIGNEFLGRGAYHLYETDRKWNLALLSPRPLAARLLDHYGDQAVHQIPQLMQKDKYPLHIAQEIESGKLSVRRMSVHPGALPHLHDTGRNGGLKAITAQANGLPYIPGSSVKGALRTVWLDWQTQQDGAYERFLTGLKQANLRGRDRADDILMERKQVAEGLRGSGSSSQSQNRDLFRAVQVSDLLPDKTQNLTRVYAVLSMSYQSGEGGFARPSNGGQAGAQAWECLNPEAGATYSGTITVDLDLLARMTASDRDAQNLAGALGQSAAWGEALAGYGHRFYDAEATHYDETLGKLPGQSQQGIQLWGSSDRVLDWVLAEQQEDQAENLLPLGMGTGLLAHSLLGANAPEDIGGLLGDEQSGDETLLKGVLDTGIKRSASAYHDGEFPRPKSRRVTGFFIDREGRKLRPDKMQAERPLGWTALILEEV